MAVGGRSKLKAKAALTAFALLFSWWLCYLLYLWCSPAGSGPAVPADSYVETPDERKLIALTFDDGPRRATTTALLDGLAQRGVPATFFLIGEQVPGNEDLLRRMDAEGHQIGIHSYTHVRLTDLNNADFSAEVDRTRTVLKNALGHNDFLLRPPYGMTDAGVKRRAGAPIILWSIDPEDWRDRNIEREVSFILSQAQDGDIILLHDIFPESVEAALRVVDALHEKGFYFLTVSDLFAAKGIPLERGKVYWNAYP